MAYQTISVYSITEQECKTCIIPTNQNPSNLGPQAVQVTCISALSDDGMDTLIPYTISTDVVPNNPKYAQWTAALEAVQPFSTRVPINVRIYADDIQ